MKVIVKSLENIGKQKKKINPRDHQSFSILVYNF